jgi:hypothetical protein
MTIVLILVFIVIDLVIFNWMLNYLVGGVTSFTEVVYYYVVPRWVYYFLAASEEERRSLRRAFALQVLLALLIAAELWVIMKVT